MSLLDWVVLVLLLAGPLGAGWGAGVAGAAVLELRDMRRRGEKYL